MPYAVVDAEQVKQAFESAGFQPLSDSKPLIGSEATRPKVSALLRDIRDLPDKASVVIYYSGHSWTNSTTKDLWLQLYDNQVLGDDGLSFSALLSLARETGWNGELAVIVDSCYSGKAIFSSDLVGDTVILASSDRLEPSRPIQLPTGQMSAFTHALLLAAGSSFEDANTTRDGILTFDQLSLFATSQLIDWDQRHLIDGPMNPKFLENITTLIFEYDPSKSHAPNPQLKRIISRKLIYGTLTKPSGAIAVNETIASGDALNKTRALVTKLLPYLPPGPETEALGKLSEGRVQEALADLKQISDSAATPAGGTSGYSLKLLVARLDSVAGLDIDAAAEYETLLKTAPTPSSELKLAAASAAIRAHQFDRAEYLLSDITKPMSKNQPAQIQALARNDLGILYSSQGKFKKAEAAYREALRLAPDENTNSPWVATINSNLADAYRLDRKFPDAEKQYSHTIALQDAAGVDASQQITDLEKYSSVLSTEKKAELASEIKSKAEALKADTVTKQSQAAPIKP